MTVYLCFNSDLIDSQKQVVEHFKLVCNKILLSENIDKNGIMMAIQGFRQRMEVINTGNRDSVLSLIDNIAHYVNIKAEKQTLTLIQPPNKNNTGPQFF